MINPVEWLRDHGYPQFSKTMFRGEAAITTTPFGHDFDTFKLDIPEKGLKKRYRFHAAVDRDDGVMGLWYVPFDCFRVDIITGASVRDTFGTLVRLFVADADFEIRVAHTWENDFDPAFIDLVKRRRVVPAGTLAGKVGNYGISTGRDGRHTHTEVVSLQARSKTCDSILCAKNGVCEEWESEAEIAEKVHLAGFDVAQALTYLRQREYIGGRGGVGKHDAQRPDYLDGGKLRTWYDSRELFNGV